MIERIRETVRTVVESGVNASYVDERLNVLQQALQSQIASVAAGAVTNGRSTGQL